jgi:hypothetical protein
VQQSLPPRQRPESSRGEPSGSSSGGGSNNHESYPDKLKFAPKTQLIPGFRSLNFSTRVRHAHRAVTESSSSKQLIAP